MKFDWDKFKSGEIAVRCDTEEKAKAFLAECHKRGMKWSCGDSPLKETNWSKYKVDTCYSGRVGYGPQKYYESKGYTIIDYPFSYPTIVITTDGKTVTALQKEGKTVLKRAVAKCSPADAFDFNTGARLAFDRLLGREAAVKDEPEPVKLYCVRDVDRAFRFRKGKVYEATHDYQITDDCGETTPCKYSSIAAHDAENPSYAGALIPLVSRPAKVGEWVYVSASGNSRYEPNKIYKVLETGSDSCVWFANDLKGNVKMDEYLVLDGYQPEPEGYSGKVVCVKKENSFFTVGRVYEFKDGFSVDDDGCEFPRSGCPVKSVDELNNRVFSEFIPLVE